MANNWGLEKFANCPLGETEQGRYEAGNPHQTCHHFRDARDFYGPLHVINWMRSDHSFDSDTYASECERLGIGTPDERQEFLDKTFRKVRK